MLLASVLPGHSWAVDSTCPKFDDAHGAFSVLHENDLFNQTDRGYTAGQRIAWVTREWETPKWPQDIARRFPLAGDWCSVRAEYALNQAIFTPTDTARSNPDLNDRPYAGWLEASFALLGESAKDEYGRSTLDRLSLGIGVVGPASLGEDAQRFIHRIRNLAIPQGWAYQLHNEPTVQLGYQRSWRSLLSYPQGSVGKGFQIDVTPHAGFTVGNAYVYANGGATLRIGYDLGDDYGPPRVSPSVPGSGFFIPQSKFGWYVFASVDARAVARNIFLDGNTFEDSRRVTKNVLVGDLQAGAVVIFEYFRLSYTHVWRTPEFSGGPGDVFGVMTLTARL